MKLRHLLAAATIAVTPLAASTVLEHSPVEAASCRQIINLAKNPDVVTFYCSGSGIVQLHIRCYYYDGGPYLHRWTQVGSPTTRSLSCTSSYPFRSSSWVSYVSAPFATNVDHNFVDTMARHRPEHATGCTAWKQTPTMGAAYCNHLDQGYWMYLLITCKDKWSTNVVALYSSRTYLPYTTKTKSCPSGMYLAAWQAKTGSY